MGFEGGDAPGGSLSRGSLEKFTQKHKIATGTLSCLSANILTNLNKFSAIINPAFFMNLWPILFEPLQPGYAFE